MIESYAPLLLALEGLAEEGIRAPVAVSLSPTLLSMMTDDLLSTRLRRRLGALRDLSAREVERTAGTPWAAAAARHRDLFERVGAAYEDRWRGDLVGAFRRLRDAGAIEILSTAATHAFLPIVGLHEGAFRAQVRTGLRLHRRLLGRAPEGFWLPECAWPAGRDDHLRAEGVRYVVLDAHGLLTGRPRPRRGVYAPAESPGGLALFGRDMETSRQVWSSVEGYPGDPWYREFYRDLGYDAEYEYIRPFLPPPGDRKSIGIKYHRVTGPVPLGQKAPYEPEAAALRAEEHARHFVESRVRQCGRLRHLLGAPPVVVAPYDAELFGHWWFEGPLFLEHVLRALGAPGSAVRAATPSEVLATSPRRARVEPAFSTWGNGGYADVWLNRDVDWIYPILDRAAGRLAALAARHTAADGILRRALDQAARELLLAQASDWAFIISAKTAVAYAEGRLRAHIERFDRLSGMAEVGAIDEVYLRDVEARDNLFSQEIDYRDFGPIQVLE